MQRFIDKITDFGDKTVIVANNKSHTYADLSHQISVYKQQLDKQINNGQVVVLLGDYTFHSAALLFALSLKQCIVVPVTSSVTEEIQQRVDEAYTDWILTLDGESYQLKQQTSSDKHHIIQDLQHKQHAGLILFSSGSTGKPKAMIHDLDNLLQAYLHRTPTELTILVLLMFDHIGGIDTLISSLAKGMKIVIPSIRDADVVAQLIEQHKVNVLPSSPTFLNLMLIADSLVKYDLSSLEVITYGAEVMPQYLLTRLKETLPSITFIQKFGTSETGVIKTSSRSSTSLDMRLNDPNQEYKTIDGELYLRSKTQVLGYLNASMENFTQDGWFKTGDLIEETDDGYLRIIGRSKEVINVGGEKVLPVEVESTILELDAIDDCMVYAEQNAIVGQVVTADIVLKSQANISNIKKQIRNHCKAKLDSYKVPVKIYFKDKTNFGQRFKKMRLQH